MLNIIVLSQEDSVSIPKNIIKLNKLKFVNILLVSCIDAKGALVNKKTLFFKGFGLFQSMKMALLLVYNKLIDFVDNFTKQNFFEHPKSLSSAALRCKAKYIKIKNPNSDHFLSLAQNLKPDLIVSFSCPVVLKSKLLKLPKHGCINLHCSLLPDYAGLLPSFWTLYNNEKFIGSTVHYMDDKIDNGKILGQIKFPVPKNPTIFKVVKITKDAGGELMCKIINRIFNGVIIDKRQTNNPKNYFSWPTISNIKEFKRNGGRLI
tara:strand:- start:30 stop:815 length:786 start_codon:yes stop_codon:yes gene_type:complete